MLFRSVLIFDKVNDGECDKYQWCCYDILMDQDSQVNQILSKPTKYSNGPEITSLYCRLRFDKRIRSIDTNNESNNSTHKKKNDEKVKFNTRLNQNKIKQNRALVYEKGNEAKLYQCSAKSFLNSNAVCDCVCVCFRRLQKDSAIIAGDVVADPDLQNT